MRTFRFQVALVLGLIQAAPLFAQWTQTNGLTGGTIHALITIPDQTGGRLVFASTENAGVFRSTDNGDSWTAVNYSTPAGHSLALINDFVATDNAEGGTNLFAGGVGGIFLSRDYGTNWTRVGDGIIGTVSALVATPNNEGGVHIFAGIGTSCHVYLSIDNGMNWSEVTNGLPQDDFIRDMAAVRNADGQTYIFAGTWQHGVFRSSDDGRTWVESNTGLSYYSGGLNMFAVGSDASGTQNIFLATNNGIYVSADNGDNWNKVSNPPISTGLTIAAIPNEAGSTTLFTGGWQGLCVSTDAGATWVRVGSGMTNSYVIALWVSSNTQGGFDVFAGTNGGGVFLSTNLGESWTAVSNGIINTTVEAIAFQGNTVYAGTQYTGIFRSTDGGDHWVAFNRGLPNTHPDVRAFALCPDGTGGDHLFAAINVNDDVGYVHNGVYMWANDDDGWTLVSTDLQSAAIAVRALVACPNEIGGTNLFVGASGGVFLSTDDGVHWIQKNNGLSESVNVLAVNGRYLFAGTLGGGIYRTDNDGTDWVHLSAGLPQGYVNVTSLAVAPGWADGTHLYAGIDGSGVLLSTDDGDSWAAVNNGLTYRGIGALLPVGTNLFDGSTGAGVFLSLDAGANWSAVNDGAPHNFTVAAMAASSTDLFVGSRFLGLWRRPLSEMVPTLPPAVSLTVPNGGEIWASGTQQDITWASSAVDNVKLEYTTDDGTSWTIITESTPASAGSLTWTVPEALSTQCRVRISDASNQTVNDMSDTYFMIYKSAGHFVATENNLGITTTDGTFGCAWGDFDGDGYLDLYIPGSLWPNTLYRNDGGTHFADVSGIMGLTGPFGGLAFGAVWADFNGDGRLDLLCTDNGLRLYRNDGNVFTDISEESGLTAIDPGLGLVQTAVGDYDQDGDLDIAFAGAMENPLPIRILRDDNGVFTDVAPAMGIAQSMESWNPEWVDVDNDGDLDLWMPTIRTPGQGCVLLINNDGQLTVSDPATTGIAANSALTSCWGDFNNDGYMDLFLVPWQGDNDGIAKLYRNNTDGTFTDIAPDVGLNYDPSIVGLGSRGTYWGDYDNDGDLDLLIGTWWGGPQKLFRNDGDSFTEVGAETGAGFFGSFRSAVFVDYDNDGSLDIYYNEGPMNGGSRSKLLLHNTGNTNHWIGIIPRAVGNNTAGIGTRVTVFVSSLMLMQFRDIQGGGGGITTGDLRAHFGLGTATKVDSVMVRWPTGEVDVFKDLVVDSYNTIEQPTPKRLIQKLTKRVDDLVRDGSLSSLQGRLLKAPLNRALRSLERGMDRTAIVSLRTFILQVRLAILLRRLSRSEAQVLIDEANQAIDLIRNPGPGLANLSREGDTATDADAAVETVPHEFALNQNYPNPFNPTTNMQFTFPNEGRAVLKIFNTIGQEVRTLFDGSVEAGRIYRVTFNASGLPSGIYIARLQYGGQTLVRKMLLVK